MGEKCPLSLSAGKFYLENGNYEFADESDLWLPNRRCCNWLSYPVQGLQITLCPFDMINFANLFYYSTYFCNYSWVSLHFLVLFMDPTVLFQLIFTFIYSTFSKINGSQINHLL